MATRKIVDCKDLSTGNKVFPRTHAAAVVMDDGRALQDTLDSISSSIGSETYMIDPSRGAATVYQELSDAWDAGVRSYTMVYHDYVMPAAVTHYSSAFIARSIFAVDSEENLLTRMHEIQITSTAIINTSKDSADYISYSQVNHGTSNTTLELTPNTLHVWDTVSSLTLTLGASVEGRASEYIFKFDSGSTATTLSLPSSLKWNGGEAPTIEANKTYQISILNGLAVCVEFE